MRYDIGLLDIFSSRQTLVYLGSGDWGIGNSLKMTLNISNSKSSEKYTLLNSGKAEYILIEVNIYMSTVKAYYDGITFFPIETLNIPKGKVVNLTIAEEETPSPEIARKLAQLAYVNSNLEKLNETEPLPPEFDEILAQRVNFTRVLDL